MIYSFYTLEEKYQIVVWHHNGISERRIQTLFANMFPNRPIPARKTIENVMHNLRTYGCLTPRKHMRDLPPRPIDPAREQRDTLICASVVENPTQTTRDLGEEFGLSGTQISKILNKHGYGYHPYKLRRKKDSSEPKQGSTAKPSHKENVSITTKVEEAKVKYSSATPFSDEQESETDEENDNVATVQGFKEIESQYFGTTSDDRTKDTGKSKGDNLATLQGIKQEILLSTPETSTVKVKLENVSSDEGTEQKNTKIFTAKSGDFSKIGSSTIVEEKGWQEENSSTVRGAEEEIHYSAAKSSDISTGESSSVLEGTKMEYVEYSTVNSHDIKQGGVEKVANITGVQEETVNFSTAESENVKSPMYTESITGINLHTTQYKPSDATDNSFISATIGSDDFYKQESLIEQELDKIKVEPMLAEEEIVLNPEDLQNADNEFEKLLEGTESTNIVT